MDTTQFTYASKKEKIANTMNDFMKRNGDFNIEVYVSDSCKNSFFGRFLLPMGRNYDSNCVSKSECYQITWDRGRSDLKLPYDDIIACYEETDEYGSQVVTLIMKCGVSLNFECVGLRV